MSYEFDDGHEPDTSGEQSCHYCGRPAHEFGLNGCVNVLLNELKVARRERTEALARASQTDALLEVSDAMRIRVMKQRDDYEAALKAIRELGGQSPVEYMTHAEFHAAVYIAARALNPDGHVGREVGGELNAL